MQAPRDAPLDLSVLDYVDHPVFAVRKQDGVPYFIEINEAACHLLGRSRDDVVGQTAETLFPGMLGTALHSTFGQTLETGVTSVEEHELSLQGADCLVRISLKPLNKPPNETPLLIGSIANLSGTQIIRNMRSAAETVAGEMEQFINLAAHDLRSPMQQVKQVAALLRRDFVDMGDGKVELIDLLEKLGESAMGLIGDVLSQAQAAEVPRTEENFDFGALMEEVIGLLDPSRQHIIRYETAMMDTDRVATQIILRNLIDNAIKYAACEPDETYAPLVLKVSVDQHRNDMIAFSIKDNGNGFTARALKYLKDGQLKTGSGFGLLGVRRLLHTRGGELLVAHTENGRGAIVKFMLPGRIGSSGKSKDVA
ncbi:MAG: ATP-binding protein [Pseudomonadota bacterium]